LVGQERHRSDLAGPMTFLAAILEDRFNVFVESHGWSRISACHPGERG